MTGFALTPADAIGLFVVAALCFLVLSRLPAPSQNSRPEPNERRK